MLTYGQTRGQFGQCSRPGQVMASSVPAPVEAKEAFLFSPEWTTGEELRLLEGIEEFGYGNWYVSNPQFVHAAECLPW